MRSYLPLALLIATPCSVETACAQSARSLHPPAFCDQIKALTASPEVAQAHWGVMVSTLDGTMLCGLNQGQLFRPASNAKLFTAAAALALLGPDQTFNTAVMTSKAPTPTLDGDLTLLGGGDAYLSTRAVPYTPPSDQAANAPKPRNPLEDLAGQVAATGIRHITGDIVGEDTVWPFEPYPSDWSLEDALWGYGAPVSALSVEDNKLALTICPGASTVDAPVATLSPDLRFYAIKMDASTVASGRPTNIVLEKLPGSRTIRVYGSIPLGSTYSDDIAIDDPAEYAALAFKFMLESRGITVDGRARAQHRSQTTTESLEKQASRPLQLKSRPQHPFPTPSKPPECQTCPPIIATHTSPTLLEDVTITLKVSQNLHAELLLRHLAETFGNDGSTAQGVRVIRQFALNAGLHANDLLLFDGSGLSGHDLVAPRALVQLMVFAAHQPWFPGFKAALPVGGADGSLAGRFAAPDSSLKGRIWAKTGTLGESRALSGYLTAASGRTLVFSVLVDNHPPGSAADRNVTDKILETIAAAN